MWAMAVAKTTLTFGLLVAAFFLFSATDGVEMDVCASCHPNATCEVKTDGSGGKVCNCMYGFVGNGRTHCQDKDECQLGRICGNHTVCHNTYGSYYCTCLSGYSPSNNMAVFIPNDGTYCHDVDECLVEGICGEGGLCQNSEGEFSCSCQVGYSVQNGTEPFQPPQDPAYCKEVDCGPPPAVHYAIQLTPSVTRYGSEVHFGCMFGFLWRGGDNTSVCGPDGRWTGPSMHCEAVDCGQPPSFPYSKRLWSGQSGLGAAAFYACHSGFYNAGVHNSSVCLAVGSWSPTEVLCREIQCVSPPPLPNAVLIWSGSTKIGTKVQYECKSGYRTRGVLKWSECNSYGEWSRTDMTCQEIRCDQPPTLPHSDRVWNGSVHFNSTVIYYCKEGFYAVSGRNKSVCTQNGSWTKADLLCREVECGSPASFPHAVMIWNGLNKVGTEVYHMCDEGFYNAGSEDKSVCNSQGSWSLPHFSCQEVDCGRPPSLSHATLYWNGTSRLGSTTRYECEAGFRSVREGSESVCGSSSQWSPVLLQCEEIHCGPPPSSLTAKLVWDGSSVPGSLARYSCPKGLLQEGQKDTSTCTDDGTWEQVSVSCKAYCGTPPQLPNSEVLWENSTVVVHRCVKGYYSRSGSAVSVCDVTGRWQVATINCREVRFSVQNLAVFNEKCLRWSTDGHREQFRVIFIGERDFDHTFNDLRRQLFSSSSTQPVFCLKLLPATNYTINVTAVSTGDTSTVTANTTIPVPPAPHVKYCEVDSHPATLRLRRTTKTLDPICMYEVIMLPVEGLQVFDCSSTISPSFSMRASCRSEYVAAQIKLLGLGMDVNFTLGDREIYGDYYNAPLEAGMDYYVLLRTVCQWRQARKHSCIVWAKARGASKMDRILALLTFSSIGALGMFATMGYCCSWFWKAAGLKWNNVLN